MKVYIYSGAGNTFALTEEPLSSQEVKELAESCCVDGVIFPENTFRMRIFNKDGSEAEMCGNGLRCFVKFLKEKNIHRERYCIETLAGPHIAWIEAERVCVEFPSVKECRWNLKIEDYTVHHLNTGVPHAVIFVDSVDEIDPQKLAPLIRHHPLFPEGTNVDFVQIAPFRIRTYERGVEGETLACGTGVMASALAASKIYSLSSPISVQVQSGETLTVSFTSNWERVTMEGPAHRLGEGSFSLKTESPILFPL